MLKGNLVLENGLSLTGAIVVITNLTDHSADNFNFEQQKPALGVYRPQNWEEPNRHVGCNVSVFLNEQSFIELKPAIGPLTIGGEPWISLTPPESVTGMDLIPYAYNKLIESYPDLVLYELPDTGAI